MDKKFITWRIYDVIIKKIVKEIKKSGEEYDAIGTLSRGGYVPAVHIANLLDIRHIYEINAYTTAEIKEMKNLLIVDDVTDSGDTLSRYRDLNLDIVCVCLKPSTVVKPTYPAMEIMDDEWVVFPWESKNSITMKDRDKNKEVKKNDIL